MTLQNVFSENDPHGFWAVPPGKSFCHHALFYDGQDDLMRTMERFVREGLASEERVLVVLTASKLDALEGTLGTDAAGVEFADMDEVGANPARIIPLWRTFVESVRPGQRSRGVGEPVSASRVGAELVECQIHEELLNLAFDDALAFWLVCPYDISSLDTAALDEARHSHPYVTSGSRPATFNERYRGLGAPSSMFNQGLPATPDNAERFTVTTATVGSVRQALREKAFAFGLSAWATDDLALAAHEVIANSLRCGGGLGEVSIWLEEAVVVCQVSDRGIFDEPMAGRIQPNEHSMSGRGLWMANQLCDLVQIRSISGETIVRLHMAATRGWSGVSGVESKR